MAGINNLSATVSTEVKWQAGNDIIGSDYQPLTNTGDIKCTQQLVTGGANTSFGYADEFVSYLVTIAISSTVNIDLTNVTNILQQAGIALARLKYYQIRLLSVADDPVYGTLCSSITVGDAASNANNLNLVSGSSFNVNNGGQQCYFDESAAGFTVVNSTTKIIKIVNNDSTAGGSGTTSHAASVQITLIGGQS